MKINNNVFKCDDPDYDKALEQDRAQRAALRERLSKEFARAERRRKLAEKYEEESCG